MNATKCPDCGKWPKNGVHACPNRFQTFVNESGLVIEIPELMTMKDFAGLVAKGVRFRIATAEELAELAMKEGQGK